MIEYLTTTIDRYRNKATKILQYGRNIMLSSLPSKTKITLWEFYERHNMLPTTQTMETAKSLSVASLAHVKSRISVNDEGNLLFEFNLLDDDDRMIFVELDQNGRIDIEVYGPGDRIDVYVETTHQKFLEIIG